MRTRPRPAVHRLRRSVAVSAAVTLGIGIVAGPAHAEPQNALPGLPSLMDLPGASQLTGGQNFKMGDDGRTNIKLPIVAPGGVRKQFTNAPAIEQSTRPACAPFVFVGVPGTFEINRDDAPTKPVGMLAKITDPLAKSLGNKFVATMINYDADAGVNGTSYTVSVDRGVKKAIATVTDVAGRCPQASIIIGGYSQGARIAGDTATAIGQKRTPVNPERIGGVVLISDPKRTPNSNVIADTNQNRPDLPGFLANAINQVTSDPSFAQIQMSITNSVDSLTSGALGDAVQAIAGQSATKPGLAGQDPTQAPASTSVPFDVDDPSVAPEAPETSLEPSISGSDYASDTSTITPIDDKGVPLTEARDDLVEVKKEDGDKLSPPAGVTSIGQKATGEWVAISTLKTVADFNAKKTGGWYYGRTPAQKDARRKVVDDLFLNGWSECKDKTLSWCRGAYVDGLPSGEPAKGIFIPSAELTDTRNSLIKDKNYTPPAPESLNSCANEKQSVCIAKVNAASSRSQAYKSNSSIDFPRPGSHDGERKALSIIAAVTGYAETGGAEKTVADLVKSGENDDIVKGASASECGPLAFRHEDRLKDASPDGKYADGVNDLARAWNYSHIPQKFAPWEKSKNTDELSKAIKGSTSDDRTQKCRAWAVVTFNKFLGLYNDGKLRYREGYTAPNDPLKGEDSNKRADLIHKLYSFGGCGEPGTGGVGETVAPNGDWSLKACLDFHTPHAPAAQKQHNQLNSRQLSDLVKSAKTAYEEKKPDWRSDLVFPEPGHADARVAVTGSANEPLAYLKCETISARSCAIAHTLIKDNDSARAPAGISKMIQPIYPTMRGTGSAAIHWGKAETAEPVDPKGDVAALRKDGYLWATPEVLAAVEKLDGVRLAALGSGGTSKPKGVATMINRKTGEEKKPKDSAEAASLLGRNWMWARTEAENKARVSLVDRLYLYGDKSCAKLSYSQCSDLYMKSKSDAKQNKPEYALTNKELDDRGTKLKDDVDNGRSSLDYKVDSIPVAELATKCADKTASECSGKKTASPTATTEATTAATDETRAAGTTTDAPADTPDGAPAAPATNGDDAASATDGDDAASATTPTTAGSDTAPATAGADPEPSSTPTTAGATDTPGTSDTDANNDGGLANSLTNLITGTSDNTATPVASTPGEKANVAPITQKAVAGGGLEGKRDADFGQLKGRVVTLCVPGDVVCSLPENSELAQDLVKFARNLSLNFPDMASDEGATRMAGLLAVQGLNSVASITGMPQTKLSADTLQALINLAAGGAMLAAQQPAGASLVADGVSKLPDAMPEIFAQIADVPELLRELPSAPQNAMDNTGLGKLLARVTAAFEDAGMTSPLDVQKYPEAANAMMQGLVKDNTGLVEMVTNPKYWQANAHVLYPSLKISGSTGSLNWVSQWVAVLARAAGIR